MFHIVEQRKWYFLLSVAIIVPGLIAMIYSMATIGTPFKLAIDFTGGTYWELALPQAAQAGDVRDAIVSSTGQDAQVTMSGDGKTAIIRTKALDEGERTKAMAALKGKFGDNIQEMQFNSVGPTVGQEVTRAAVVAVVAASAVILFFLVIAFNKVPHAFRYGATAIIAMLHDLLVTAGLFSLGSLIFGWEADALFLTAMLTVTAESIQDTIVVFDRIRENLVKHRGERLSRIVNRSILETMHRSIAIHLTSLLVLSAILIFGGATIKPFIAVLLIGVTTGTYSSIFNAAQLLVGWEDGDLLGLHTTIPQDVPVATKATVAS